MMKSITDFLKRLNSKIILNEDLIMESSNRFFLLNKNLKQLIAKDFFYAGIYLGKIKGGKFLPSFNFLKMIAENEANKIIVDKKSEWLFICGRDIFKEGIVRVSGSKRKGDYTLVLNQYGECLGLGKMVKDLNRVKRGVAVKNILDIGDFLRRETMMS
ncbi:MAG: hypothetical protein QW667_03315 [Candidatus Bathyarchaeia archaeon]